MVWIMNLKNVSKLVVLLLFTLSLETRADAGLDDGMLVHLSHGYDEPHRVSMAFMMADIVSEQGNPVLIYLDLEAVELAAPDAPDLSFKNFGSLNARIEELLERKVTIMVCPSCLTAAGMDLAKLREGFELASSETMMSFAYGRFVTLDY